MAEEAKEKVTVAINQEEAEYILKLGSLALRNSPGYENVDWSLDAVSHFKRKFANGFNTSN